MSKSGVGPESCHFNKFPGNGGDVASLWMLFLAPLFYRLFCDKEFNELKQQSNEAQS